MALKIRYNDEVIILKGKDKGKRGRIKKIIDNSMVIVEGVNIRTKHQKQTQNAEKPSGIFKIEAKIHISNVALFNHAINKADRVGFKFENGKKVRYFKSNKKIIN